MHGRAKLCISPFVILLQALDVFLLRDVFSDFRELSLRNYGLDPVHFVSTPSLTLSVSKFVINEHAICVISLLQDFHLFLSFLLL